MIRFRSISIALVVAALAVSAHAQGTTGGLLYASDFANWTLPQGNTPAQGAITYPNQDICRVTSNGYTFLAPKVGRPITIVDGANTETVTPTNVVIGSIGCSISAIMAHSHSSYFLKSGTAGAQEAIDYQASQPQGANVVLTPEWTRAGGSTGIVTGTLKGNTGATILDQRTSQLTAYTWNGSSYIPNAFATIAGGSTIGNCATILSTNTVGTTGAPCGTAANPAGPAFAVQLSNSGVNSFQGDPNITIDPTAHTLATVNLTASGTVAAGVTLPSWMTALNTGTIYGKWTKDGANVCAFPGATWGDSLIAAIAAVVAAGGGIVDSTCVNGRRNLTTGTQPMIEVGTATVAVGIKLPPNAEALVTQTRTDLPTPSAPTVVASGSGGGWPAGDFFFKVALRTGGGVSAASAETAVTVTGLNSVTITAPTCSTYARSYDVYISDSTGAETLQFSEPCGTNSVLTNPPTGATTFYTHALQLNMPAAPVSANGLPLFAVHNETNSGIYSDSGGFGSGSGAPGGFELDNTSATSTGSYVSNLVSTVGHGTSTINGLFLHADSSVGVVSESLLFDAGSFITSQRNNLNLVPGPNSIGLHIRSSNDVYYNNFESYGNAGQSGTTPVYIDWAPYLGDTETVHSIIFTGATFGNASAGLPLVNINCAYSTNPAPVCSHIVFAGASLEALLPGETQGISVTAGNVQITDIRSGSHDAAFIPIYLNPQASTFGVQLTSLSSAQQWFCNVSTTCIYNGVTGASVSPNAQGQVAPFFEPQPIIAASGPSALVGANLIPNNDFSQGSGGSLTNCPSATGTIGLNWQAFCPAGVTSAWTWTSSSQTMTVDSGASHFVELQSPLFTITNATQYINTVTLSTSTAAGATVFIQVANSTATTIYYGPFQVRIPFGSTIQVPFQFVAAAGGADARFVIYTPQGGGVAESVTVAYTQTATLTPPTYQGLGSASQYNIDNSTLSVTNGVAKCTTATTSQLGCSKPDGTSLLINGAGTMSVAGTSTNLPPWLNVVESGADGAISCSGTISGIKYATTFTVPFGATCTVNSSNGLVVHATGAVTIYGTLNARAADIGTNGSGFCGGAGGGSGGGAAAGTAGANSYPIPSQSGFQIASGGAAGASSGGAGANASAINSNSQRMCLEQGGGVGGAGMGGSLGLAGGSSGGARGAGGSSVIVIANSITANDGTHGCSGIIDASGGNGQPAAANSTGSGSPGGGGVVILSSQTAVTGTGSSCWPQINAAPGAAVGAGTTTTTVPEAVGVGGAGVTVQPVMTLGVTTGALNGTCTVAVAGTSTATGASAPIGWNYSVIGGGGTLGTGTVVPVWSGGSVASCTTTAGSSSGYTAATFTTSGTSGNAGVGWCAEYSAGTAVTCTL